MRKQAKPKHGQAIMAKTCYTDRFGREVYNFDRGTFLKDPDRFRNDETGEELGWEYVWFWVPFRGGDK